MQHVGLLIGATAVIATATACGTATQAGPPRSTSSTGATTPTTSTHPPVTVSTTVAAPATTVSTAGPASTPGFSRCTTADLSAKLGGGDAGLNNMGRDIVLTNTSRSSCSVAGYPGIGLADSTGHLAALDVLRGGSYFAHNPPMTTIILQPQGSAVAALGWNDAGGAGCTGVLSLEIIPPDETTHLTIPFDSDGKTSGVCNPRITRLAAGGKLTQ